MKRQSLDFYDYIPPSQKAYLRNWGWHFNKKACEFAVSLMRKEDSSGNFVAIEPWSKEQIDEMLAKYGIKLRNKEGYDYIYVANMCKADFYKKSIPDEQHVAMFIRDVIDDADLADGNIMRKWYACMIGDGHPIEWEDFL